MKGCGTSVSMITWGSEGARSLDGASVGTATWVTERTRVNTPVGAGSATVGMKGHGASGSTEMVDWVCTSYIRDALGGGTSDDMVMGDYEGTDILSDAGTVMGDSEGMDALLVFGTGTEGIRVL
jgi:hypothetical protein